MSRRLKLKSETLAGGQKAFATTEDVGRWVRVYPLTGPGRCWWVVVHEISEDGKFVNVGVPQRELSEIRPLRIHKYRGFGFGDRRWIRTQDVVTWKGKGHRKPPAPPVIASPVTL